MKHCRGCGNDKPLSEFNADRANKDGRRTVCRECDKRRDKLRAAGLIKRKGKQLSDAELARKYFADIRANTVTRSCMSCGNKFDTDQSYRMCPNCRCGDRTRGYDHQFIGEAV